MPRLCVARSNHRGAATSLAQDPGRPATGTRRHCLCAPVTPARILPATRARYPRIPGSRWPLRPGRSRARCPGRRCCSWRRCSPWSPLRGPQVRTCGTLRSVDCLFLFPPACHFGDNCPALILCSLRACLVTNLCVLVGRIRARWVWTLDTLRAGDGLRDTYSTKKLGCLQRRPGTSRNQETGTCLGALEI